MKSDLLDLDMQIHIETGKAVFASTSGEKKEAVWLPLSQIEIERKGSIAVVTLPEWLAADKGLV